MSRAAARPDTVSGAVVGMACSGPRRSFGGAAVALAGTGLAEAFYRRHGFEALGVPAPLGGRWGEHAERLYVRR